MFTTEEIFARLMNGESMDSIAKEMTEALNAAKAKKEAEDKRKAEEEAKAKRQAVINEAAEKAANAVNELIRIMYPKMASETEQLTGRMMIDMVESSYTMTKKVEEIINKIEPMDGRKIDAALKKVEDSLKPKVDAALKKVETELVSAPKVGGVTKCSEKEGCSCAGKRSKVVTLDDLCEEDVDAIVESFCKGFNF